MPVIFLFLLLNAGFANEKATDAERVVAIRSKYSVELVILAKSRETPNDYSDGDKAWAAAHKVFSEVDFIGLSQASLEALLGVSDGWDPAVPNFAHYSYGNGEMFILPWFQFDATHHVTSLKLSPSQ